MPQSQIATSHWADPTDHAALVEVHGETLINCITGQALGQIKRDERRVEWMDTALPDISDRIVSEKTKYDNWAQRKRALIAKACTPLEPSARSQAWWVEPALSGEAQSTVEMVSELRDLKDKRILDIGGSLLDSWRFLWHGDAAAVDHIEVSPVTQQLAFFKASRLFEKDPNLVEKLWFHTSPAECLPFKDCSYDIVFSRSTIHHCRRPKVFEEILRVLKPGGVFWMLEPRLSDGMYALMKTARWIRRADRGTDDPLRNFELSQLAEMSEIVSFESSRVISPFLSFLFNQCGLDPQKGKRAALPIDNLLVKFGLFKNSGRFISVATKKT